MGIFNNKSDSSQAVDNTSDSSAVGTQTSATPLTPVVDPVQNSVNSTPVQTIAPTQPVVSSTEEGDGHLITNEPSGAIEPETAPELEVVPGIEALPGSQSVATPEVSPSTDEVVTTALPTPAPIDDIGSTATIGVPSLPTADTSSSHGAAVGDDKSNLANIKQEAIKQLSPLVSLLDQTPEEKFHTTMMMLQSTDNKDLIKEAYDIAQLIPDEKAKAQALLDVVNEINYYTQQENSA